MTIFGRLFDDNIWRNIWWQYWEGYLMTIFGLRWWRPPPVLWQCSLLQATRFVTRFVLQIIHGNNLATSLHIIASVTVVTYLMFFSRYLSQSNGTTACSICWRTQTMRLCWEELSLSNTWLQSTRRLQRRSLRPRSSAHCRSALKHLSPRWWRCYKH